MNTDIRGWIETVDYTSKCYGMPLPGTVSPRYLHFFRGALPYCIYGAILYLVLTFSGKAERSTGKSLGHFDMDSIINRRAEFSYKS